MAAPTITNVTVDPAVVAPGGQVMITVEATDPDDKVYTGRATASNPDGSTSGPFNIEFRVQDELIYEVVFDDPDVVVDPLGGGVFRATAPNAP